MRTIAVVGVGKVGLPLVAAAAAAGFRVIGCERSASRRAEIAEARSEDPGVAELLERFAGRVVITADVARVAEGELIFVVVPTPSLGDGAFSMKLLVRAVAEVGAVLRRSPRRRVVAVVSTVLPGDIERLRRRFVAVAGRRHALCYNPTLIALGNVLGGLRRPDVVLIGASDARAAAALERFHARLGAHPDRIFRMDVTNAEVAKLALNSYVTMKISFANALGRLCERLPGGDARVVLRAIGGDPRIGSAALRAGAAFGGPCFPRDGRAFRSVARRLGVGAPLSQATDRVNRDEHERLLHAVISRRPRTVAVLGLAYRPGTPHVDESPGVRLARQLSRRGVSVIACDPEAIDAARALLGPSVRYQTRPGRWLRDADVVVATTAWPAFRALAPSMLRSRAQGSQALIDCCELFGARRFGKNVEYVAPGVAPVRRSRRVRA